MLAGMSPVAISLPIVFDNLRPAIASLRKCSRLQKTAYPGRPFARGDDPRRNRLGRPKNFDAFRELCQKICHEKVTVDGEVMTRMKSSCATGPDPKTRKNRSHLFSTGSANRSTKLRRQVSKIRHRSPCFLTMRDPAGSNPMGQLPPYIAKELAGPSYLWVPTSGFQALTESHAPFSLVAARAWGSAELEPALATQ